MEEQNVTVQVWTANSKNELPEEDANLLEEAFNATQQSYAPYSNFNVGAAILLENGEIISGSNQENSASPSGLCAERVAMFYANSKYPNIPIKAIAITSAINGIQNSETVYPCGACRQVMLESEMRQKQSIRMIMGGKKIIKIVKSIKSLLPLSFDLNDYK